MSLDHSIREQARALLRQIAGSDYSGPPLRDLWPKFWLASARHNKSHMRAFQSWNLICDVRGPDGVMLMDRPAMTVTLDVAEHLRDVRLHTCNRHGKPNKPNTVNKDLQVLQRMLNWAVEARLLPYCPLTGLRVERDPNSYRHTRIRNEDELQRLLLFCRPHVRALVLTLVDSGMRRMEALTLRRDQLEITARGNGIVHLTAGETKGKRARRPRVSRRAVEALMNLPNVGSQFFLNPRTLRLYHPAYMLVAFQAACAKAGLAPADGEQFTLHCLKHSFIATARQLRLSDRLVMNQTGNRSRAVFLSYGTEGDDELDAMVEEIDSSHAQAAQRRPAVRASLPPSPFPFASDTRERLVRSGTYGTR